MLMLRPAAERGHFNFGWLDTWHTFSFGDYRDPNHMGFRSLRVINEDQVAPRAGFPTHPHRDMEILTWLLSGALRHEDSMGNGSVIVPGEIQRMTAGTGVTHSEASASDEVTHLLQIWLLPAVRGLEPSYEQSAFAEEARTNRLCLIASGNGRDGSVSVHQDVALYATTLTSGQQVGHPLAAGRGAWLQVARGNLICNGVELRAGDGLAAEQESALTISTGDSAEFLLFDLG